MRLAILLTAFLFGSVAMAIDFENPRASDLGLRGHVRLCIERQLYLQGTEYEGTITSKWEFSPDGRILKTSTNYSRGQEITTDYTYDSAGRLTEVASGTGESRSSAKYFYDEKGRLQSISGRNTMELRYEYDANGRKRRIQRFPVVDRKNATVGAVPWEGGELSIPPSSGGTLTTLYDEHGQPIEAETKDAQGQVTMRIVRSYDEQGRVLGDKLTPVNFESMLAGFPEDVGSQFNEAQRKGLAAFIGRSFGSGESSRKFDSQGRIIEKRIVGGMQGNTTTLMSYNENGEVSEERTSTVPTSEMTTEFSMDDDGNMIPTGKVHGAVSSQTDVKYTYEYDSQGNWTLKVESRHMEPGGEHKTTTRRTLTYH